MEDKTAQMLDDYAYYLGVERALSPNTVSAYCSDVASFLASEFGCDPRSTSSAQVSDYPVSYTHLTLPTTPYV